MTPAMNLDLNWLATKFADLKGLGTLNNGGFKTVLSANHSQHGEVVLKLLQPGQELETIRRELAAVNQVNSPRVPRVLDVGTIDIANLGTSVWFLEQRVSGSTIRDILSTGPLPYPDCLKMALHICEVLSAAELARIVHRDVKPENIMRDNHGNYWLLDFGIARHLTLDSLTATAQPFGKCTWGYAPPEQMRNVKPEIDSRADLFALGVTIYECYSGTNPFTFNARDVVERMRRVEQLHLARLTANQPTGQDFADMVATLTNKRRHHRPQTAAQAMAWIRDICQLAGVV